MSGGKNWDIIDVAVFEENSEVSVNFAAKDCRTVNNICLQCRENQRYATTGKTFIYLYLF